MTRRKNLPAVLADIMTSLVYGYKGATNKACRPFVLPPDRIGVAAIWAADFAYGIAAQATGFAITRALEAALPGCLLFAGTVAEQAVNDACAKTFRAVDISAVPARWAEYAWHIRSHKPNSSWLYG